MTISHTARAVAAITQGARAEHDFAGWLAQVLATTAGQLGSSDELVIRRPGSWEASLVDQLVKGTVGHDDEYLPAPAGRRKLTDAKVRDIRWRYDDGISGMTQAELAAEFGVSASTRQRHHHRQDLGVAEMIEDEELSGHQVTAWTAGQLHKVLTACPTRTARACTGSYPARHARPRPSGTPRRWAGSERGRTRGA